MYKYDALWFQNLAVGLCWAVLWGWLAMRMAAKRGRSVKGWMVAAVFLGPFALAVLYFLPERHSHA
jgi:hypothetical protein